MQTVDNPTVLTQLVQLIQSRHNLSIPYIHCLLLIYYVWCIRGWYQGYYINSLNTSFSLFLKSISFFYKKERKNLIPRIYSLSLNSSINNEIGLILQNIAYIVMIGTNIEDSIYSIV